ncbi:MAG: PAS domain S-box protein [Mangrovibacterium sp.]
MNFEYYFDRSPIGFLCVKLADESIAYANAAFCSLVGYSFQELECEKFTGIIYPGDKEELLPELQKLLKQETGCCRFSKRLVHKTGITIWGEIFGTMLPFEDDPTTALFSVLDHTRLKENERLLKRKNESFRNLFLNNPQAMVIYSPKTMKILDSNVAANNFYGYSRDDMQGMDIHALVHEDEKQSLIQYITTDPSSFRAPGKWTVVTKNGDLREVEVTSHLIRYKGKEARHVMITDITERMKAERELKENQEFINHAQTIAKMGSWEYDILNDTASWSENLYRLLKVKPKDFIPTFDYFLSKVHPDDRAMILDPRNLSLPQSKLIKMEIRMLLPGDEVMWVQNIIEREFKNDQVVNLKGVIMGITDRKEAELQLLHRTKLEHILYGISQSFINAKKTDTDRLIQEALSKIGNFTQVDRAYLFLFDETGDVIDNTHEWCQKGIEPQIENLKGLPTGIFPWWMQKMRNNEIINYEDISNFPAGAQAEKEILEQQNIISILVLPLFFESQLIGFVGFDSVVTKKIWNDSDINILKSLTDLISNLLVHKKKEADLIRAKDTAEEGSRLKSAFLATISHELRTPLNPIIGYSEILKSDSEDSSVRDITNIINQAGNDLLALLEDLFDLSLATGNNLGYNLQPINCVDFYCIARATLEEILLGSGKAENVRLLFSDRSLRINYHVELDKAKTLQVLSILFKNAVKFTWIGEIEFGMEIKRDPDCVEFFVRDTGIGFSDEKKELIFEYFRQIDDSYTRTYGGLGIGLSIAKQLVGMMKGEIVADSVPGEGSLFRVILPTRLSLHQKKPMNLSLGEGDFSCLHGRTVLVVDDNPFIHEIVNLHVQDHKMSILKASNGQEAVQLVKNQAPDFILMDLVMPVMDGFEATRYIKAMHPQIPVAAITAHSLPKDRYKAFESGCDEIITKPIYPDILLHILKRHLDKHITNIL